MPDCQLLNVYWNPDLLIHCCFIYVYAYRDRSTCSPFKIDCILLFVSLSFALSFWWFTRMSWWQVAMKLAPNRDKFMEVISGTGDINADIEKFCTTFSPFLKENHEFLVYLPILDSVAWLGTFVCDVCPYEIALTATALAGKCWSWWYEGFIEQSPQWLRQNKLVIWKVLLRIQCFPSSSSPPKRGKNIQGNNKFVTMIGCLHSESTVLKRTCLWNSFPCYRKFAYGGGTLVLSKILILCWNAMRTLQQYHSQIPVPT